MNKENNNENMFGMRIANPDLFSISLTNHPEGYPLQTPEYENHMSSYKSDGYIKENDLVYLLNRHVYSSRGIEYDIVGKIIYRVDTESNEVICEFSDKIHRIQKISVVPVDFESMGPLFKDLVDCFFDKKLIQVIYIDEECNLKTNISECLLLIEHVGGNNIPTLVFRISNGPDTFDYELPNDKLVMITKEAILGKVVLWINQNERDTNGWLPEKNRLAVKKFGVVLP